eukprot:2301403-Pleurochrysis_carterae.AAC.1
MSTFRHVGRLRQQREYAHGRADGNACDYSCSCACAKTCVNVCMVTSPHAQSLTQLKLNSPSPSHWRFEATRPQSSATWERARARTRRAASSVSRRARMLARLPPAR